VAINSDFKDLFAAFREVDARWLVVGGYALAFHGFPRFTKDLDVWIGTDAENAARVYNALDRFGAPLDDLTEEDLTKPNLVFQIGIPPNRIDVLTTIDGVDFGEAWQRREELSYAEVRLWVIGRDDLIRNKRATGRPQDFLDIESLERKP